MTTNNEATSSRVLRRTWSGLAVLALAVLALPLVYRMQSRAVQAEDAAATEIVRPLKEPTVEFLPRPSEAEQKILDALEKPTTMDFVKTPLEAVISYLQDLHAIEIQLDLKALEDAGTTPDTEVNFKLSGVPLRAALRLLLRQHDLASLIKNDVLLITTMEVEENELVTRVYPVGDLTIDNDYDSLIEAITNTVRPDTWDEVGGPANVVVVRAAESLVISQTQRDHDEILQLLRSLRAAQKAGGVTAASIQKKASSSSAGAGKMARGPGAKHQGAGMAMGGVGGCTGGMGGCTGSKRKVKPNCATPGKGGMGGGMFNVPGVPWASGSH